ncbi:uroporphyrinogen-III synthase [Bacillus ectoiniformans]|uniref:uroporphyrinogen-III synthase n=1 Tax=Bacillus ectoiniformans TaxID=1494429 RepID=UPI00195D9C59|nr:uroporphyrinogen-III synthase [Bacillus ectoiniformans]MBM7648920.1 uroporphyrinogen-III synthase [Bacillus ectoiniformans]
MSGQPLLGKQILITRPIGQSAVFADMIEEAGGVAHVVPLIAFRPFQDEHEHQYLQLLHTYDWMILTSKNGVDYFFSRLKKAGIDLNSLTNRFAVIGTKTEEALRQYGYSAEFMPGKFSADDFAKSIDSGAFSGKKVLIPKGNLARETIAAACRKHGIEADEWIVYETYFPKEEKQRLLSLLTEEKIDVITFTSPSAVRHFVQACEEGSYSLPDDRLIACIGPVTEKAAIQAGMNVRMSPEEYTVHALTKQIINYFREE